MDTFVSTFAKPLSINIRLLAGSSSLRPALPCRTGIASKSPSTPKYLTPIPACTKEISELLGMALASWRNRQMTKKRSNYSLSQTKLSPSGARAIPSFLFRKRPTESNSVALPQRGRLGKRSQTHRLVIRFHFFSGVLLFEDSCQLPSTCLYWAPALLL
jgi:hypothetical protein